MILTRDNYYTPEADWAYMSCSQYQSFCECEAKALAKLEGRWIEEPSEAFTVGNYFHTFFEGPEAHEQFIIENEEVIFKKRPVGAKYAPYEKADQMIATAENDPLIKTLIDMPGENELIMTGMLFGVPWRIRMDKYVSDGRLIIDWKTVANINELKWNDALHEKATFIDNYGYMMRAAVYSEIEKQNANADTDPMFVIVAISKQDPPDKDALSLNHRQRYDYELEQIKERLPFFQAIKDGSMKPKRCGCCDYCRATKRLQAIRPYYTLMPEFKEGREDDYDDYYTAEQRTMLDNSQEAPAVGEVSAVQCTADMDKA